MTRSTESAALCAPAPNCSPAGNAQRLNAVFADEHHVAVQVTWTIYQRIVAAYRNPDRAAAKTAR